MYSTCPLAHILHFHLCMLTSSVPYLGVQLTHYLILKLAPFVECTNFETCTVRPWIMQYCIIYGPSKAPIMRLYCTSSLYKKNVTRISLRSNLQASLDGGRTLDGKVSLAWPDFLRESGHARLFVSLARASVTHRLRTRRCHERVYL